MVPPGPKNDKNQKIVLQKSSQMIILSAWGVPKISFCQIFKIKSFISYGGMHQNSEMACGVGGMAFGRSECVPRSGPQMVKKCIPWNAKGPVWSISHPGISDGQSFSTQVHHLRKYLLWPFYVLMVPPQALKITILSFFEIRIFGFIYHF